MAKGNKDVKRGIVLYLDGKEVQNNARAIQGEMRKLKKEIDNCTVGSDEYIQKTKQYRALNSVLQEHKAQLKGIETQTKENAAASQNWLQKGIAMFNQYSVAILGFTAAFTGVAMKIADFRKKNMEKESSQANLKALTGLDDASIEWLTKQAEILSTTMDKSGLRVKKSAQEILEAYMLVGSNKPELLQNKEALSAVTIEAMRLAEAAKIELKEAVESLTTSMNQFEAAADETGRYVNVLAAGSQKGSANVAQQAASIMKTGVAARTAGIEIETLDAAIETLAEKGIKGEIAGTQLNAFLSKLTTGERAAKLQTEGLTAVLKDLNNEFKNNEQLAAGKGMKAFSTEFSERGLRAALILSQNVDKLEEYRKAVTGTNIAVEQAAINSATMEAKMAQLKNQINETGMALAKDLAPVFSKFTNLATKFVMALPPIVKFLKEYGETLMVAVSTLILYTSWTQIATKATAAWNAVVTFATTFSKAYSVALMQLRLMQSGSTAAQIAFTRAVASSNVIQRAAIAMTSLFRAAMLALTGQTQAATAAMRAFAIASASTGVGAVLLLLGAVATLVTALNKYNAKQEEAKKRVEALAKAEKEAAGEYDQERAKLESLSRKIHDNTISIDERKKAIDKMREIVPDYHAELDEEGRLIRENKKAIDDYLRSFKKQVLMKHVGAQKEEAMVSEYEAERAYWEKWREWQSNWANYRASLDRSRNGENTIIQDQEGQIVEFKKGKEWVRVSVMNKQWEEAQELKKVWDKTKETVEDVIEQEKDLNKRFADVIEEDEKTVEPKTPTPKNTKADDRIKKAVAAIELEVKEKQNILRQSYVEGKIDKKKYNAEIQKLEMERLQRTLEIAGLEPEKVAEIQGRILEIQMKAKEELEKMSFDLSADQDLKRYHEQTQKIEDELLERIAVIDSSLQLGVITQDEYEAKVAEMWEKYDADMQSAHESYVKQVRDRKDETKEELTGLAKTLKESGLELRDLAEEIGESIGEGLAGSMMGQMDTVKNALKSLLNIILDAIEKIIIAAEVESSLLTLTGLGTAAGVANLAKLVGIKIAFAALKQAVNSFDVGGYTGVGKWDEPAGIVHKGEFVANRFALANPAVKAVLDVVDNAQRNGTVANLTSEDIRAVATPSYSGGSPARAGANAQHANNGNAELVALIKQCIDTMEIAKEAYETPSPSYCWLEGDGGINEKQELLSKIKKNARRND